MLVLEPTYGEYAHIGQLVGAEIARLQTRQKDGFRPPIDVLAAMLQRLRPRLTFLCNPNNPTGVYLGRSAIERLLAANPDGLLVIDEAYVGFVERAWDAMSLLGTGRVALLRSMTKDYALAGLRLGYLLAEPDVIDAVRCVRPPWNVNAIAQAAGVVALQEMAYSSETIRRTREAAQVLCRDLAALGLDVWPSDSHFFLVRVRDASETRRALLHRGILVRDCASFGLPDFVRVAARLPKENERLVDAWEDVLSGLRGGELS
jgi:histidinol-phosphate aminotransferase